MKRKLIHSVIASLVAGSVGISIASADDFIVNGGVLEQNKEIQDQNEIVNIDATAEGNLKEKINDTIILGVEVNSKYKDVTIKSGNGDINFQDVTTNVGQSLNTSTNKVDGAINFLNGLNSGGTVTATSPKTIDIQKDATISETGALNLTSGDAVTTKNITNNNNLSITSKNLTTDALTTSGTGKTSITSDAITLNSDASIGGLTEINASTLNAQNVTVSDTGKLSIKGGDVTLKVVNNANDFSVEAKSLTVDELNGAVNKNGKAVNTYIAVEDLTVNGETSLPINDMFISTANDSTFEGTVKVENPFQKALLTIQSKTINLKKGLEMDKGGTADLIAPHKDQEDATIKYEDDVVVAGTKEDPKTNQSKVNSILNIKGNLLGTTGKSILAQNNGVVNVDKDFKLLGDKNDSSATTFKVEEMGTVNIYSQEGSQMYFDAEASGSEFNSAINVDVNNYWEGKAKSNGGMVNVTINDGGKWLGEVDSAGTRENVRTNLNGGVFVPKTGTTTLPNVAGTGTFYLSDGDKENVMWSKKDDGTLDIITTASSNYTVENLVKDGSVTFVARDKTTANPDKLTIGKVVNLENDAFKEDTTKALTNHKLLLVGDNKKLQEDFKNSPNKEYLIYTYSAPTENSVFKNSGINLAGGFKKPRFVIEEDATNKGTFNVKVVGFTRRDLSIALFGTANALYDNAVAGKWINDTYSKREKVVNGADGFFVRFSKNTGKEENIYKSSSNTFDIGYNKNVENKSQGIYVSVANDKLDYEGVFSGQTTLKSTDLVAYHIDKNADSYIDYVVRFGKTKTKVDAKDDWDHVQGDFSQNRLGASVEYGKNIQVNERLELIPQVQLALTHVSATKLPAYDGYIDYRGYNSLIGRLGVEANYKASEKLNFVSSLNLYREFMGKQNIYEVEDGEVTYLEKVKHGGTFYGIGLGVNYKDGNMASYANVEKLLGKNRNNNIQFNLGIRFAF